jgi:hypothetical protein
MNKHHPSLGQSLVMVAYTAFSSSFAAFVLPKMAVKLQPILEWIRGEMFALIVLPVGIGPR